MMNGFEPRPGLTENSESPSELMWEIRRPREGNELPRATVAIPTYKRFDTLLEAIASARSQSDVTSPDVIIVDNEGHSGKPRAVRAALGETDGASVRYFVNPTNLGMFGNWNRCIELAETPWLTILNDDDVLSPNFLSQSLRALDQWEGADGIVCKKAIRDRRPSKPEALPQPLLKSLKSKVNKAIHRAAFRDEVLRVDARRLFFGNALGNGAGFLFKRSTAVGLGGYDAAEWPSADFLFYVRMALNGTLLWLNEELADVGLGDNESMAPEVLLQFVVQLHEIRQRLVGTALPARWIGMAPLLAANHVRLAELVWGVRLDPAIVEEQLGFVLPRPDLLRERLLQLRHGVL